MKTMLIGVLVILFAVAGTSAAHAKRRKMMTVAEAKRACLAEKTRRRVMV